MDIIAIISFAIKVMFGERIIQISCACIFFMFFLFIFTLEYWTRKQILKISGSCRTKAVQYKNVLYSSFSFTKIPKKSINKI